MPRVLLPFVWVVPCLAACHRAEDRRPASLGGDASPAMGVAAEASPPADVAQFSAPIGAAKVGRVDVVAGLVASDGVVRAMALSGGRPLWTVDALKGVAWAPDAELRLQGAAGGVAIVWHGLRGGKSGRTLVVLGPGGERRGDPIDVGASLCATADGVAWLGPHAHGPTQVLARRWVDPETKTVARVPSDRDPSLVCGDHEVHVLGDGDDDLTASPFIPGDASAHLAAVVLRESDFSDEQREHDEYAIGDDLGILRVGTSGAMAMRDVPHAGAQGAWRRLKHTLSADDEAVSVDGDASAVVVVATHDAEDACQGSGSTESVQAVVVDRKTGEDSLLDLSPPDCDRTRGPFWIGTAAGAPLVAWVERPTKLPPKAAPITGVAYRVLSQGGVRAGNIEQSADAVADGGCDDQACAVAMLVREPGSDGMRPAPIRVFTYP